MKLNNTVTERILLYGKSLRKQHWMKCKRKLNGRQLFNVIIPIVIVVIIIFIIIIHHHHHNIVTNRRT